MSTNLRTHWKSRLGENDRVATADELEVETMLNSQGWGWCAQCGDWHAIDTVTDTFMGEWRAHPRFTKPFVPTGYQPPTSSGEPEGDSNGHMRDQRNKSEEMARKRLEDIQKMPPPQKMPTTPGGGPQRYPYSPWADGNQSQKQRKQQEQDDALKKMIEAIQQKQKAEQEKKAAEEAKQAKEQEKQKQQEAQEKEKQRQQTPKKWPKKEYTRCPDCGLEACVTTWMNPEVEPDPLDPADRISYALKACGCKELKGLKNPNKVETNDAIPW